ncbi:MAG: hypothetical protein LUG83_03780 [Lachnospiraceae bacterium]|nr:hypothetical protein [Lachnospiraceae bacterium]
MLLLVTVMAAIVSTLVWYNSQKARDLCISALCYMFWGASIMWFVDAVFEYIALKTAYFTPEPAEMMNDLFLGLSVIAFAMLIWLGIILIRDPKGVVRQTLKKHEK